MNKIWIILAVIYILLPYDLLPDFIPLRGWIDDLLIAAFLAYRLLRRPETGRNTGDRGQEDQKTNTAFRNADFKNMPAHQVLGVKPNASAGQIKEAYRRLAVKYHPDKFAHLDEDFRQLAEERFKQIQAAYQELMASAGKH